MHKFCPLVQPHQFVQIFCLFYKKRLTFFYFTHPLLQNIHINLFILHIYLIKYSFFYIFYYFLLSPLWHKLTTSSSPSTPTPSQQPFNKIQPFIHWSSTTTITTTTTQSQSQQLWPTRPPCPINSPSPSPFPNGLLDRRGWSAFPTHSPPKLIDRTQSMAREISVELSSSSSSKPEILKKKEKLIDFAELRWEKERAVMKWERESWDESQT